MPGIVGLMTRLPRPQAEAQLFQMVDALSHEPFYASGTVIDEARGVYVGWVARKGSFADGMPLRNERGDELVFSGEEFSDPGTVASLRSLGHRVEADGPSYLVHLVEEDPCFLERLNGRFHGLLLDHLGGVATLFNDRYGMHRLYYHTSQDSFYFAAEAKAILAVRPDLRSLDPRGLGEFVTCGCVMEDRTLFGDIHVLPGAAAWRFRRGVLEERGTFFHRSAWEHQSPLPAGSFYEELRSTFVRILPRYFGGREAIGMSLTGGLDTRMIMAWQRRPPASLPCYTFGGMFRECRDVRVARRVAAVCGQPHDVISVGRDFLSRFSSYAERTVYLTDGCVDVSHSPDLYANERAREIAPVRMTGNYGSEVLRRVVAFKPQELLPGLFRGDLRPYMTEAAETFRSLRETHPLSFAVFRQAPWHHYGLLALEQTQLSLRSPYLDNDLVRLVFRAPASAAATSDVCMRLIADGDPALARIPTDGGAGGGLGRLGGAFHRIIAELSRKAEYAYDHGMPQSLARLDHALRPWHLERLFLGRHKFCHFRIWYRDGLAAYVREILLDPRTLGRTYLDRPSVEMMVRHHLEGDRNFTAEIHRLLTIELAHRLLIDSSVAGPARHPRIVFGDGRRSISR